MNPQPQPRKNWRFALRVTGLLLRGFMLAFLVLLVIGAGLFLSLPKWFNSERARALIALQLSEIIRRPVQIQGVILTLHGVKLRGVRIEEKIPSPRPMLESDFVLITVKLRPLLDRKIELNNVRLASPRIHLWRTESGAWNFSDIVASSFTAPTAPMGRFAMPISLAAESAVIEDGILDVEDRLSDAGTLIEKFHMTVRRFDFETPFGVEMSFNNTSRFRGRQFKAAVSFKGDMSLAAFNWDEAYAHAQKFEFVVGDKKIKGSGMISDFRKPKINAEINVPALSPEQWASSFGSPADVSFPPSRWQLALEFEGLKSARIERLDVSAGPLSLSGSGSVEVSSPSPKVAALLTLGDFPLSAVSDFRGSLAHYGLKGSMGGTIRLSGTMQGFAIHEAILRLRGLQAALEHAKINGGDVDLNAADDFSRVSLSVSKGAVSAFSNSASKIDMALSLVKRNLLVSRLAFMWEDTQFRLKGRVLDVSNPKEVSISGNLDRLQWEKAQQLVEAAVAAVAAKQPAEETGPTFKSKLWVHTFKYAIPKKFPDTIGHIRIGSVTHKNFSFKDVDALWDVRGITPTLKKTSGDVRLSFGPGRIEDIQAVQASHKFLKIVFLPYIYMHKMNSLSVLSAATAYPQSLDFTRIEGQYGIKQGVATTQFFHVDGPQLVAYADGMADFGAEKVDMNILTRLTGYRAPLPEWWVDEMGRPAIGFRVVGNLNYPDIEPRLRKMAKDEIERVLEEARGRAKGRFEAIEKLQTL